MSTRHSAAPTTNERSPADRFRQSVREGLTASPRRLDPRYFYDELGSALFEAICRLPWYRVTASERALLARHADEILTDAPRIVELGCGSGEKLVALLESGGGEVSGVHLVDVSRAAIDATRRRLELAGFGSVSAHCGPYEEGLDRMRASEGDAPVLVLFLGSNIGNFELPAARAFLGDVRSALRPGDRLLLGTDLVKPERDLVLAYDDPLGVTAAFNLNILQRINRELGGTFDLTGWRHRAFWNPQASRVEIHLVSAVDQRVQIGQAGLDVSFAAGESIWTESSYKYHPRGVIDMLDAAGFLAGAQWIDEDARFCLTLAAASPS